MPTVRKLLEKINIGAGFEGELRYDEPMSLHTTFRVGGPADAWYRPSGDRSVEAMAILLKAARDEGVPVFMLGGGANIVVADRGIRGVVLDTTGWTGCSFTDSSVLVRSGTDVDSAADACAERSLGGLDFLAGMPGTVGGAVWMNARCYGSSVSDVLQETEILDEDFRRVPVPFDPAAFSYKRSPFQDRRVLIVSASFRLLPRSADALREAMRLHRADREAKGHYRLPSAGSSFKNDYAYGKPTGAVVDGLGLRGLRLGGAQVADWHGNIIVNTGNARATDIRGLARLVADRVREAAGLELETEMLYVGDWDEDEA
ncbi:MAG: UDP-N-acetylenolpyruvoylglucosamine reductase [Treponema sp. GWB1_62_6]|nr:MAG: UDP-N-acetylenolpyruvoylglucosamine reductase [Treponema sp. GWC1_61_84]OHE67665.1 MAG: UDP-N-acetylenolpyruvoylglucosamine reductase [Treponema sp. GWB1_62_6]OHE72297.1 MAG: UDP-N-acetylenolpyruvoylglucosamine reductase [Treponema sp. RIFOXYC1_FULL_61_9]